MNELYQRILELEIEYLMREINKQKALVQFYKGFIDGNNNY